MVCGLIEIFWTKHVVFVLSVGRITYRQKQPTSFVINVTSYKKEPRKKSAEKWLS